MRAIWDRKLLIGAGAAAAIAAGALVWWAQRQDRPPDYVAVGNGRVEAEAIHIAARYPARVVSVLVDEGETVAAGQTLAQMDTAELEASLIRARADVAQAREAVAEAKAAIAERESDLTFARQELDRAEYLVDRGHVSVERLDQRRSEGAAATAALEAARARLVSAERAVEAQLADARRIRIQIDESTITAPRAGRVQYRLAEPGEVLQSGGKVVTLLDLSDVFMTIFLPTADAGRAFIGAEARIVLDAAPDLVIPATVSFVAAEAQFTPKEVETRSEREKLMFRVKIAVDPDVLRSHARKVKTGLPGEAYVMLGEGGAWPDWLTPRLPSPDS